MRTGKNRGQRCARPEGHSGNHKSKLEDQTRTGPRGVAKRRWDRANYYGDEPCPGCGGLKGKGKPLCRSCSAASVPPPWPDGGARLEAYLARKAVG
jgi:hypothetical protein